MIPAPISSKVMFVSKIMNEFEPVEVRNNIKITAGIESNAVSIVSPSTEPKLDIYSILVEIKKEEAPKKFVI